MKECDGTSFTSKRLQEEIPLPTMNMAYDHDLFSAHNEPFK